MQKDVIIEVIQTRFDIRKWLERIPHLQKTYLLMVFLAAINFLFILPDLVPQEVMHNGAYVNSVGHYTGYFFGIFVPILIGFCSKKLE
jgi:predicted tellurium resistance membrane protein TerC